MKRLAENNEADGLLQSLLDITPSTSTSTSTSTSISSQPTNVAEAQETYQLPVRVGINRESLDEGGRPWIVGRFSPGVATDHNHPTGHSGVDLKADAGTPVYPIASGIVSETGTGQISGNYVKVAHENGRVMSYYGHLESISCQKNQEVNKQTILGTMGDTGNAKGRGAHLHYEVKVDGSLINPYSIVGKMVGSLAKKADLFSTIMKLAERFDLFSS